METEPEHVASMRELLEEVDEIHAQIDAIAEDYAREEMRKMSSRWPNRRIEFVSGMGTSCVYVPFDGGTKQITGTYSTIRGVAPLEWMQHLDDIGENIGGGNSALPYHFAVTFLGGEQVESNP